MNLLYLLKILLLEALDYDTNAVTRSTRPSVTKKKKKDSNPNRKAKKRRKKNKKRKEKKVRAWEESAVYGSDFLFLIFFI